MPPPLSEAALGVRRTVMEAWRPPPALRLSEWVEEHGRLIEAGTDTGPWHNQPYQVGIMDAISDVTIPMVTVMKSARVGYTKILGHAVGYYIHHRPCPIMMVQPTIDDGKEYSKEEIEPTVQETPVLRGLVSESKSRNSKNTITLKKFPGGLLQIVGANSPRGFRRVSRKLILLDEVDGYPPSAGNEGDQIKLAIKRGENYWDRKVVMGSTPTIEGASRIAEWYDASDQRRFNIPCPHCGRLDFLVFSEGRHERGHFMRWPKHRPMDAVFVCRACSHEIRHRDKFEMMKHGEWVGEKPFAGNAGFAIWTAYSYSPNATWGHIAAEWADANEKGPSYLQVVVNTTLGETWRQRGSAPEWKRLYDRREKYRIGVVPLGGLFLTAGVDVQKDRIEWEVVAWGRGKRTWSVDYGIEPGDTSDLDGVWGKIDALLNRTWKHESGVEMAITRMGVDSGYNTQVVYNWCRRYPLTRVLAVFGSPSSQVLLGHPVSVDCTTPSGRKLRRGYKRWPVGDGMAKSELYGWLGLESPTDEARASGADFPAGWCHFPEYPEEFFKQLTAENLVPHKKKGGYTRVEWELIPGRRNERLDCRVYARAAAASVGIDRFAESDWAALEAATAQAPRGNPGPKREQNVNGGVQSAPPGAPGNGQPERFIPRRPGWMDRRK